MISPPFTAIIFLSDVMLVRASAVEKSIRALWVASGHRTKPSVDEDGYANSYAGLRT